MLQRDVLHQQGQLRIDDISSPIIAQIFDFCDPELFSETLQNSEVTSSNCCYDQENSSYTNNPTSLPTDVDKFNNNNSYHDNTNANTSTSTPATTATSTTTTATTYNTDNNSSNNNLSTIFDSQDKIDNDISASIDFSSSSPFSVNPFLSTQQYQFDFSSVQPHQIPISEVNVDGLSSQYPVEPVPPCLLGPRHQPLPSVFEEECLSSVPSYASCSFFGPAEMTTYMPTATMTAALSTDSEGIFTGGILRGSDFQLQDLDYQGDNGGIYCPDSLQSVLNPADLQALSGDSQQLVGRASSSTPMASEISSLEDSTFKVGKLSVEQRKEKIHRYMKKRNERNFTKKIKYACRKTLADSRPRVRGRFAKNDDFGETHRTPCSNHEEDDEDELVVVKEEDAMNDSSTDIIGHITGVNSFKYNNFPNNYSIQSWI
ncbi:zinc finger protein HD1-like isoform X2 [Mangifera indica]|uniref:zinc finger protein HD1-like isoform X2 n=1 Tax=Mangifera indica TaxID=29780 RepID=UPI001CFBA741|nr:zinc finger protein HD1-like isoform X2 [Mangifera indica]